MIARGKTAILLMGLNHPPLSINHPRPFRIRLRDFLTSGDILDNSDRVLHHPRFSPLSQPRGSSHSEQSPEAYAQPGRIPVHRLLIWIWPSSGPDPRDSQRSSTYLLF